MQTVQTKGEEQEVHLASEHEELEGGVQVPLALGTYPVAGKQLVQNEELEQVAQLGSEHVPL